MKRSPSKTARKKSTDWFERNFIEMNTSKKSSSSTLDQILLFPSHISLFLKLDFNECGSKTYSCHAFATCVNELGSYSCKCKSGYIGNGLNCRRVPISCADIKTYVSGVSRNYVIDPDGEGGLAPFTAYCDMTDKKGVGVTVISHDSESRTVVNGHEDRGSYVRNVHYTGASLSQLASLTRVSSHCEQFIKYECYHSGLWFNSP